MLVQVALSPGKDIDMFIFVEAILIAVIDFLICVMVFVVGIFMKKHFRIGLKGLHRRNSLQRPIFP